MQLKSYVLNRRWKEIQIACNLNSVHHSVCSALKQWTETKQEHKKHRNVEQDACFCLQLMASKTNKLNLPSCRLHSLSVEAKEIAFKPSADTYVFMPVSKAMKMARCPGLRKKPMPLFLNLIERYTEIQSAAHQTVFLKCWVCACVHESNGTCRKCRGDYTVLVFIMSPRQSRSNRWIGLCMLAFTSISAVITICKPRSTTHLNIRKETWYVSEVTPVLHARD